MQLDALLIVDNAHKISLVEHQLLLTHQKIADDFQPQVIQGLRADHQ